MRLTLAVLSCCLAAILLVQGAVAQPLECRYDLEVGCYGCDYGDCEKEGCEEAFCCSREGIPLCAANPLRGESCGFYPFCNDMPCTMSIFEFVQSYITCLGFIPVTPDEQCIRDAIETAVWFRKRCGNYDCEEAKAVYEIFLPSWDPYLCPGEVPAPTVPLPQPVIPGRPHIMPDGSGDPGNSRNPFGEPFPDSIMAGVRLETGSYEPVEVDLALPGPGLVHVIGRTYNAQQSDPDDGTHIDSDGYQGFNWFQTSQPEVRLHEDVSDDSKDRLWVISRATTALVYKRLSLGGTPETFSTTAWVPEGGMQGGAVVFAVDGGGPDTYTHYDQTGVQTVFFGFDSASSPAKGQFWKRIDPAGNTIFAGGISDSTNAANAITNGYTSDGFIKQVYDAATDISRRRYTYTYSSSAIGMVKRLTSVAADVLVTGSWSSSPTMRRVGEVQYDYYTSDGTEGKTGDLKLVHTITPTTESGLSVTWTKYFRYSDATDCQHALQYVLEPEGYRRLLADSHAITDSDSTLNPYASRFFAYDSSRRITSMWYDGNCGCGGGGNGTYTLAYSLNSSTGYFDWKSRTIVTEPDETSGDATDNTRRLHQFNWAGQPTLQVATVGDPSSSSTRWVTAILRDNVSQVYEVDTPASVTGFTYSTGAVTHGTTGEVTEYTRYTTSDFKFGLLKDESWADGTGTAHLESTTSYTSSTLTVGPSGNTTTIAKPFISSTAVYPVQDDVGSALTTTYTHVFHSSGGTLRPKQITVTNPIVTSACNGSDSATTTAAYFRLDGTSAFARSATNIWSYTQFQHGLPVKLIEDANTTNSFASGDDPNSDFGITEVNVGHNLTSNFTYDDQGRLWLMERSSGRKAGFIFSALSDGRSVTLQFPRVTGTWDTSSTITFYGPASYTVTNHRGRPDLRGTIAVSGSGTTSTMSTWVNQSVSDPLTAISGGTVARMQTSISSESGARVNESRTYFNIPSSGVGTSTTNYDVTKYVYDGLGRLVRTTDPSGTITRRSYDAIGRLDFQKIGLNDKHDFGSTFTTGTNDMMVVSELQYDNGNDEGNSRVTRQRRHVDSTGTNYRDTIYVHDVCGNRVLDLPPVAPFRLHSFDNLGHRIVTAEYSSDSGLAVGDDPATETTNRVAMSKIFFDQRGDVYKTQAHKITQSDGTDADNIATDHWYDADGRLVKTRGEQLAKTAYDRLGRVTNRYVLASMNDSVYGDADDVAGDVVLEEEQSYLENATGNPLSRISISRHHTDYGGSKTTGSLDGDSDLSLVDLSPAGTVDGRVQITAMYYDAWERVTDMVALGDFGAADYDRDSYSSVPSRSDTALVTSYSYNTDGTVQDVTDPLAKVVRTEYDGAGRKTAEIRNYVNGTPSSSTGDDDLFTRFAYTTGHMTKMWVDVDGDGTEDAGDQVTTYAYGVTKGTSAGDSKISSNNLLYKTVYPEQIASQAEADRRHLFAYNAQGQAIWVKDQTGNIIETDYDTGGRETHRRVTTLGTGLDNAVLRVSMTYLSRGLPSLVTQYDNATAGSGSVVDEVKYSYDDWGNISDFELDRDSAISSNDYEVEYVYAKAGSSTTRQTVRRTKKKFIYGSTQLNEVVYTYSSTGSLLDDDASRVTSVLLGSTTVAEYSYLGQSDLVGTDLPQPDVFSRVHDGAGTGTAPAYQEWDRFNRVTTNTWKKDLATDRAFYDVRITYDRGSNIVAVKDMIHDVTSSGTRRFDARYSLDALNRLLRAQEGDWDGTSLTSPTRDEQWKDGSGNAALSQTGNWARRRLDLNGDADFTDTDELDDTGVFSDANELKTRDTDSNSSVNYTLAYNLRGDQTDDGKDYTYKYDAFGRLKEVRNRSTTNLVSEYKYNGLGYRTGWHYDADADGDVDANDPWYYFAHDDQWRIVGTFRGSDTSPKEAFVYHAAGLGGLGESSDLDAVILRDRDINSGWTSAGDGTLEERRYLLQNWRGDVSVVIRDSASSSQNLILEWIKYSAYGVPFTIPWHDQDADGVYESADLTTFNSRFSTATGGGGSYDVRIDTNMDGTNGSSDITANNTDWFTATSGGRGRLSRSDVAVRHGYAGYQWDPNLKKYHVRHRAYDPDLGRWLRRDPLGYVDGLSLFQYVSSMPVVFVDPLGLRYLACQSCSPPGDITDPILAPYGLIPVINPDPGPFRRYGPDGWPHHLTPKDRENFDYTTPGSEDRRFYCSVWATYSVLAGKYGTLNCLKRAKEAAVRCCVESGAIPPSPACANAGLAVLTRCNTRYWSACVSCVASCMEGKLGECLDVAIDNCWPFGFYELINIKKCLKENPTNWRKCFAPLGKTTRGLAIPACMAASMAICMSGATWGCLSGCGCLN